MLRRQPLAALMERKEESVSQLAAQFRALVGVVTSQHEAAVDSRGGEKLRQQRGGKLEGDAVGALDNDLPDRTPVVIDEFFSADRLSWNSKRFMMERGFAARKATANGFVLD